MALFRRRTRKPADDAPAPAGPSPERTAELEARIEALTAKLSEEPSLEEPSQEEAGTESRIAVLNELGQACAELGLTDEAITHYEASMALREQFGPAYNGLLELYNTKLREAATLKDDDGIGRWTTRLDDLMALSKRVMRSNY